MEPEYLLQQLQNHIEHKKTLHAARLQPITTSDVQEDRSSGVARPFT